jgi:hypothetical protein
MDLEGKLVPELFRMKESGMCIKNFMNSVSEINGGQLPDPFQILNAH